MRLLLDHALACHLVAQGNLAQGLLRFEHLLRDYSEILGDSKHRTLWEDVQRRRAFALVSIGRVSEALPLLKEAANFVVDEKRDEQLVHLYLGTCQYELGQYDLAKQQFLHVIGYGVGNELEAEARYRLAAVHWRQGAVAQAKMRLEEAVSVFGTPNEPKLHQKGIYDLLSKVCHYLGDEESAQKYAKLGREP